MKIRIVSDLHLQINDGYGVELNPDNCDYTLIAGDLGPDFKKNSEWIRKNVKKGAFISGNHDAYQREKIPLEDVKEYFHKEFPIDSDITYFDDDVGVLTKDIGENILLIADVLYTDYKFRNNDYDKGISVKKLIERNMHRATPKMSGSYMNDFNYYTRNGKYEKSSWHYNVGDDLWFLSPKNYLEHFNRVFKKITKIVENNKDKDIILMTHHCISKKCISREFDKNSLNASYISNKDSWIKKHPNIKLIVSGHVHGRNVFHVGSTLYVLNPLGYIRDGEHKKLISNNGDFNIWSSDFFVNTETWTIEKLPYNNDYWEEKYQEHLNKMLKNAGWFI